MDVVSINILKNIIKANVPAGKLYYFYKNCIYLIAPKMTLIINVQFYILLQSIRIGNPLIVKELKQKHVQTHIPVKGRTTLKLLYVRSYLPLIVMRPRKNSIFQRDKGNNPHIIILLSALTLYYYLTRPSWVVFILLHSVTRGDNH